MSESLKLIIRSAIVLETVVEISSEKCWFARVVKDVNMWFGKIDEVQITNYYQLIPIK